MLNVSTINARVLYCHKPENKLKRRFFIKSTYMQFIENNLNKRMQNIRLKKDLRTGIERLLPKGAETSATMETPISRSAKRCGFCNSSRDRKSQNIVYKWW